MLVRRTTECNSLAGIASWLLVLLFEDDSHKHAERRNRRIVNGVQALARELALPFDVDIAIRLTSTQQQRYAAGYAYMNFRLFWPPGENANIDAHMDVLRKMLDDVKKDQKADRPGDYAENHEFKARMWQEWSKVADAEGEWAAELAEAAAKHEAELAKDEEEKQEETKEEKKKEEEEAGMAEGETEKQAEMTERELEHEYKLDESEIEALPNPRDVKRDPISGS